MQPNKIPNRFCTHNRQNFFSLCCSLVEHTRLPYIHSSYQLQEKCDVWIVRIYSKEGRMSAFESWYNFYRRYLLVCCFCCFQLCSICSCCVREYLWCQWRLFCEFCLWCSLLWCTYSTQNRHISRMSYNFFDVTKIHNACNMIPVL
jgi:hypothetical protein